MLSAPGTEKACSQDGFTLIELMVAVSLISIALVGVMGGLDSGARLTLEAQRHEQAVSVAQKEIERLRELPYDKVAMTSVPSHADDGNDPNDPSADYPRDPNYYVQGDPGTHFLIMADYGDIASGPAPGASEGGEPLLADAPGEVEPGPESVEVAETDVTVWRYVTCQEEDSAGRCSFKRITVAVMPTPIANDVGPIRPFYVSTVLPRTPEAGPVGWMGDS